MDIAVASCHSNGVIYTRTVKGVSEPEQRRNTGQQAYEGQPMTYPRDLNVLVIHRAQLGSRKASES